MSKAVIKNSIFPMLMSCFIATTFVFASVGLSEQIVQAQSGGEKKPARKTKRVQTVTQKNAKKFEKVSEAFEQEKDKQAKLLLDQLSADPTLNNFEKAYLANFLGVYYFERDQLDRALTEFKKIVASPEGIPEGFYSQTFYTIAQVYFSKEDYKNALKYAQRWFKTTEDPPADAYMLLGQAYYALKQYDKALPNVKKGIQKYVDVGSIPKEGWLNLLSSIYRQKSDYRKMLPVTKQLVRYYPKKTYLATLGGIYNELGDQSKMTAIYLSMYDQGLISSESEKVTLASLLLSQDNPYKASTILGKALKDGSLKKNMKHYRLYSQALLLAKEYKDSLVPLSQAAKLSEDGKLYYQLGQSYLALNRWKEAEQAINKAFEKGKLEKPGNALISLGLVQFELKKFKSAKATFQKAAKFEKNTKDANSWIKYVDSEVYRLKELEKPVVINIDVNV